MNNPGRLLYLVIWPLFPTVLLGQSFSGRFTSAFYAFERSDTTARSSSHARGYQIFSFDLQNPRLLLRTYGQLDNDFGTRLSGDPRVRIYTFYLQWKEPKSRLRLKIGRQPIFSGAATGTIDGLHVQAHPSRWLHLAAFGGALMPSNQKLRLVDKVDENYMAGGLIRVTPIADLRIGLSYFNKKASRASYQTLRADSVGNVFTQIIQPESQAYQFAALDVAWEKGNTAAFYGRSDYDVSAARLTRAELAARSALNQKLTLNVSYTFRSPRLPKNSIFSVFDIENNHELEAGAYYRLTPALAAYANFAAILYEQPAIVRRATDPVDENRSIRLSLGVDFGYGSLSYVRRRGYAGELDGVNAALFASFRNGTLLPILYFSQASYKLDINTPERETLLSAAAGLSVRPAPALSFDGQLQVLNNRFYTSDVRLLLRAQYWYFSRWHGE